VAQMFALIVLFTDDFVRPQPHLDRQSPESRFLLIARKLPLELQMVLSNRTYGSFTDIVPFRNSETAFKKLEIEIS